MGIKVYPWRGRIGEMNDRYGVFPETGSAIDSDWKFRSLYASPYELGEKFGAFVSKKHGKKTLRPVRVLSRSSGKQQNVITFLRSGRIESLTPEEFTKFKEGLGKGYGNPA